MIITFAAALTFVLAALLVLQWLYLTSPEVSGPVRRRGNRSARTSPEHVLLASKQGDGDAEQEPPSPEAVIGYITRRSTWTRVVIWMKRMRVPEEDREDVAQEVLLQASKSANSYIPTRGRLHRWLNKIAFHVASKYNDSYGVRQGREELCPDLDAEDPASTADQQIMDAQDAVEEWDELWTLIDSIPSHFGAILVAHDLRGMPIDEIAKCCGMPESTVYKHHERAIRALNAMWEGKPYRLRKTYDE